MLRRSPARWSGIVVASVLLAIAFVVPPGLTASFGQSETVSASPLPAPASIADRAALLPSVTGRVAVAPGYVPVPGVVETGPLPAGTPLEVDVGLAGSDPSGFEAFLTSLYAPGSPSFHHFLSASEFVQRYGPSASAVGAATAYFEGAGLSVTPSPDRLLLEIRGPAGRLATAFSTSFETYRAADGRPFISHPSPASLPDVAPWTGAYGLGNVTVMAPAAVSMGSLEPIAGPAAGCSATTSVYLDACQIEAAYGLAPLYAAGTEGTGLRIGIVDAYDGGEPQTQLESDVAQFSTAMGLPAASVVYNYPVPTSANLNATSNVWGLEESLDLEWSHAAAPGATIEMTFSPDAGAGLYASVDWLVAHQIADVISLSWGENDVGVYNAYNTPCPDQCNATTDGSYAILSPVLALAAAEGISVFSATGDCGAADGTSGVSTNYPASDPDVTAVGGTVLTTNNSGVWQSEVAWSGNSTGASSPGCNNRGGSGGGYSPFPRPWWQAGSGVPSYPDVRATPDVALDAATPVVVVLGGSEGLVGGTSLGSPVWAGIAALADETVRADVGLLNPVLYAAFRAHYSTDFHDITSGNNGYPAGAGWDPVTGIGTPIVGALLGALTVTTLPLGSLSTVLYDAGGVGAAPLTVTFGLTASGGSGTYPLKGVYFGDGNASLAPSGSTEHVYPRAGVYAAQSYVADSTGNLTVSAPLVVVAGGGSSLNVTLHASSATPAVGVPVTFTPSVIGGTPAYSFWYSFGDGSYQNWSAGAVSYAFPAAGSFCAVVVARDSASPVDGGESAGVPIAVGGAAVPDCSHPLEPLTVTPNSPVATRDAPADFPSLFTITGGLGGAGANALQYTSSDPYVAACDCAILRDSGNYSIRLFVNDSVGQHAVGETNVSVVPDLRATFTDSITHGDAPLRVNFSSTVSGGFMPPVNGTIWTFGDGASAVGTNATETYSTPGTYLAVGHVEDRGSGNASEAFVIDVLPSGVVGPAITATIAPAVDVTLGSDVTYSATAFGPSGAAAADPVRWDLGNGSSAWGATATSTYEGALVPGSPVSNGTLSVYGAGFGVGLTVPFTMPEFGALGTGGFAPRADALSLAAFGGPAFGPVPVTFSGNATAAGPGGASIEWYADGSLAGSGASTSFPFSSPGTYTVVANASDPWGDRATFVLGVQVNTASPLSFVGGPSVESGAVPLTVTFSGEAQGGAGGPYSYRWSFGDGNSSVSENTSHAYTQTGTYTVDLVVIDRLGDAINLTWQLSANTAPPSFPLWVPVVVVVVAGGAAVGIATAIVVAAGHRRRRPTATP